MRRLYLLGPVRVDQINNTPNETVEDTTPENFSGDMPRFRSRRTIALLGYLAAERRPVTREFLAALFWPDEGTSKGRGNLRRELHNLTQILPGCWELDRQTVTFTPSANTDVDIYSLLKLEKQENWLAASERLGGEFLEALYLDKNLDFENWLSSERDHWRQHAETILTHVIEGLTRRGRYSDALQQSQRLLQFTPWNEAVHRQIMRLLSWTGQRGTALRQFEICKQVLKDELSVEPAGDTVTLYQQIKGGELVLPPQVPAFLTEEAPRHEFVRMPIVAREREMGMLDIVLDAALTGDGRVAFVTGGPGRGKTALMEAFIWQAMEKHSNLLVARGNCNAYSGIGDPYLPFRDIMAMLTGDVESKWDAGAITRKHAHRLWAAFPLVVQALLEHAPNLIDVLIPGKALLSRATVIKQSDSPLLSQLNKHIQHQQTSSKDVELSYLFQQISQMLRIVAQQQPLMLIMDDMQWADTASISLLFHLGRRFADTNSKVLIVCAYRSEEITTGRDGERHPLAKPLNEFKRTFGDVSIELAHVEEIEARRFVDAILDIEPNQLPERFRKAMLQRTGAHPLFTVELLQAMRERGDLVRDNDGYWIEASGLDWDLLPTRVEAVIKERIDRLEPDLQEILTIASVEGETFTAQVLADIHQIGERNLLRQLSMNLEQRYRLVLEQEGFEYNRRYFSRYKFSHFLFQDYLYKRLSPGEQRLLHGDLAAALEKLFEGKLDEMAVQLAHHFHEAGDYNRSFHYYRQAAQRAARSYANEEAIKHFTQAIKLGDKIPSDNISLGKLHHARGLAYNTQGNFERACADFEETLQFAHSAGDQQMDWRALIALGRLWAARDYNQTRDYFESALELARHMDDPIFLASSLNWMGNWYANAENPVRAVKYHQEALNVSEKLGGRRNLANTLDLLGIANLLGGNTASAVDYHNRAVTLFRELDDRPRLISSLLGRASSTSLLVLLASLPPAHAPNPNNDIQEAILIAREIGSLSDIAWAHWELSNISTVQGNFGRALEFAQKGLLMAIEIGHREWEVGNRFALGIIYLELFSPEEAQQELEIALTLANELQSRYWVHHVTGVLAGVYLMVDDLKSAQTCLDNVISHQTPMDTLGKRYCWIRRVELALAQENPEHALDIIERLIISAPGMQPKNKITYLWMLKGNALAEVGFMEEAETLLITAIENIQLTGEYFLRWRLHASLGRLYQTMGQQVATKREFSTVSALIGELAATISDEVLKEKFLKQSNTELKNH